MHGGGMGWKLWPRLWATPWIRLQKHLLGHGCETAEPQQDSRPRGGQLVCGPRAVSAPSNQLKAKRDRWMDGWMGGGMGWKLWPWPWAAPWIAKSKERWMDGWVWNGVEALAVALSSTLDSAAETPPRARLRNSRTPSRIQAQGVAHWFADQGPFQHLRTS